MSGSEVEEMNKPFKTEISNTGMSENLTIFVEEINKNILCVIFPFLENFIGQVVISSRYA